MNNYITLDTKKYMTKHKGWEPIYDKPGVVRLVLSGSIDVTWGPAVITGWRGLVIGPVTAPGAGWGTIANLRTTIQKTDVVGFTDHYGNSGNVIILGSLREDSKSSMWDSPSNEFTVEVELVIIPS